MYVCIHVKPTKHQIEETTMIQNSYSHISSWCSMIYLRSTRRNWRLCLKPLFSQVFWAFLACVTRSLTWEEENKITRILVIIQQQSIKRSEWSSIIESVFGNLFVSQSRKISQVLHSGGLIALDLRVRLLSPSSRRNLQKNSDSTLILRDQISICHIK